MVLYNYQKFMKCFSAKAFIVKLILFNLFAYLVGHSVCCHVHGFEPYFYISCPPGMGPDDISHFHQILEVFLYCHFLICVC